MSEPDRCGAERPVAEPSGAAPEECEEARQERLEREEFEALGRIVHSFRGYPQDADWEVSRWEVNYRRLPPEQRALVPGLPAKAAAARQCIYRNTLFIRSMLGALASGGAPSHLSYGCEAADAYAAQHGPSVSPADAEKVRYVLKNLARDWSAEGAAERAQSYGRVLSELQRVLGDPGQDSPPRVLVPGSGLARLCVEIASLGYEAMGNEFSYYMLLAASFVLNSTDRPEQWALHPWVHSNCNQLSDAQQLRPVLVPDVRPADMVAGPGRLSMCAGDFVEAFAREEYVGAFDAVATCFFIDTAQNIVDYIATVHRVLKPGGAWVNLGPLLYHWAESGPGGALAGELSIELSLEDVLRICDQLGFEMRRHEMVEAKFMHNPESMLATAYNCSFWTMVKRQTQQEGRQQLLVGRPDGVI